MAITTAMTQAELARVMAAAYEGHAFTACLLNVTGPAPATDAGAATWLQHELLTGTNGYGRWHSGSLPAGTYSTANTRNEQAALSASFSASGGALVYTHILTMVDTYVPNTESPPFDGGLHGSVTLSATTVDVATEVVTCTGHNLADNQAVVLTVDSGGTMPTGLTAGTLYYVDEVDANTFTLHTATPVASGNIVDITATGSGTLRVRRAVGSIYKVVTESNQVTLSDGQSIGYTITLAVDD